MKGARRAHSWGGRRLEGCQPDCEAFPWDVHTPTSIPARRSLKDAGHNPNMRQSHEAAPGPADCPDFSVTDKEAGRNTFGGDCTLTGSKKYQHINIMKNRLALTNYRPDTYDASHPALNYNPSRPHQRPNTLPPTPS